MTATCADRAGPRMAVRVVLLFAVSTTIAFLLSQTAAPLVHAADEGGVSIAATVNQVSSFSGDDVVPAVAYDSTRNEYLVVWQTAYTVSDNDLWARRISATGAPAAIAFEIVRAAVKEEAPAVAYNPATDQVLIVWHEASSATDYNIYGMRVSGGSNSAGTRFAIATSTADQRYPTVGYDPVSGGYLVVWQEKVGSDEFAHYDILGQRLNGAGSVVGSRISIATGPLDEQYPAISQARTASGRALVVWQEKHSGRADQDVASRLVASDGTLPNSVTPISTWEGDQLRPRVAYNVHADQFMVVWEDRHAGEAAGYDIYMRRVSSSGTLVGSDNTLIAGASSHHNFRPDIAYNADSRHYLMVWGYGYTIVDIDIMGVWLDGQTAAPILGTTVSDSGYIERNPAVASSGSLPLLVAWEDSRNQATQGFNVYAGTEQLYRLSGRVYRGEVGDDSTPLADVTVTLNCSSNDTLIGTQIASTTTDASGWYGLLVTHACNYYNIMQTDLPGYTSNGATSVDGVVVTENRIRYTAPLAGKTTTGNRFFDAPPPTVANCTSCEDCEAKLNGAYGEVRLTQDLDMTGQCVDIQASNKVFDCQGHIIHGHMGEFSFGVGLHGNNNIVRGCTISGFESGISVLESANNQLKSNVLTGNGNGISLHNADGNKLESNQITQNQHGIYFSNADNNQLAGNRVCTHSGQDLFAINATGGNTLGNTQCDAIYNWNGDNDVSACSVVCTPNATISVATAVDLAAALTGSYNKVTMTGNIALPGGLVFGANHATLDCNGHSLTGSGSGAGILIRDRLGAKVHNCVVSNYATGIEMRGSVLGEIKNSTITANATHGMRLLDGPTGVPSAKNTVSDSQITTNGWVGVVINTAGQNTILNSSLSNNTGYGLRVLDSCDQTITGVNVGSGKPLLYRHDLPAAGTLPSGSYGGVLLCNVHHASLANVQIDNGAAANDGISLYRSSASNINNATIRNARGIEVNGSHHIRIFDSELANLVTGVALSASPYGEIYGNNIHDGGVGVSIANGSDNTQVHDNTVKDNTRGIEIDTSANCTISANTIVENDEEGVAVNGPGGGAISGNTLTNNRYGLYFSNTTTAATATNNKFCYNTTKDIYNNGPMHTSSGNTCAEVYRWRDATLPADGCKQKCIGWYQYRFGYNFPNPPKYPLSFGCPFDACQGDYVDTFGEDQIYLSVPICIGIPICFPFLGCACLGYSTSIPTPAPDPHAVVYYAAAYHHAASPGECTGMSNTSLRFFYGDRYPSEYKSGATRAADLSYTGRLENELDAGQGAIMSSEIAIPFVGWYADGAEDNGVATLNAVKQALDQNKPLSLIMFGSGAAHTVVATAVREEGDIAKIYIYDSNYPAYSSKYAAKEDDYPYIVINKAANTFSYPKGSSYTGVYVLPYSVSNGSFTIPLSALNMIGWGNADTQVEDDQGRVLGWRNDVLTAQIPNAAPIPNWGGTTAAPAAQHYFLPDDAYTIHHYGKGSGVYHSAVFQDNAFVTLQDVRATAATHDRLAWSTQPGTPAIPAVSFGSTDAAKPFTLTIGTRFEGGQGTRTYALIGATVANNTTPVVTLDPTYNSLVYTNRGAVARTYTVEFRNSMVAAGITVNDTLPVARRANITIPAMTTHIIAPDDWLRLAATTISVQSEACGNTVCGLGESHANCPEDCAATACAIPTDNLEIAVSTQLCPGDYVLPDGGATGVLRITGDEVTLDCNGAHLIGNGAGVGIFSRDAEDITITNCALEGYSAGIRLEQVEGVTIAANSIFDNANWGMNFIGVRDAQIMHTTSLRNGGGLRLESAQGAVVGQNMLCENSNDDLRVEGGTGLVGSANRCDKAAGWNDPGVTGCAYTCATTTTAPPMLAALISPAYGATRPLGPIAFRWQGVIGASRYRLQVDDDPGFGSPAVDVTLTGTTHTSTALVVGRFHWRVRVRDGQDQWQAWTQPWLLDVTEAGAVQPRFIPLCVRTVAGAATAQSDRPDQPTRLLLPLCGRDVAPPANSTLPQPRTDPLLEDATPPRTAPQQGPAR